ncbi:CrcB family protein [Streptomyces sp. NPDC048560]|uniref:fluoride efflux transporter FluC n=1 Tax=Streptomyces sp. NPDC048560 TaxID=3155488 RepID=UPI003432B8B5
MSDPAQRAETAGRAKWHVLGAIAAGGALGGLARYAALVLWPAADGAFPWAVLGVNVTGSALIGVLMVLVAERDGKAHPLVRPFLGVGVLGGFTTFSTYAADVARLLDRQEALTAMAYAAATLVGALGAVWAAAVATRALVGVRGGERPA